MTLVSKDDHGVETSISAHKCILSISSGYLENVINLPDNHNHNLQLDISCMGGYLNLIKDSVKTPHKNTLKADPTSISQLVDFAYTGKISFTATDFDRLATAIDKLQEGSKIARYTIRNYLFVDLNRFEISTKYPSTRSEKT